MMANRAVNDLASRLVERSLGGWLVAVFVVVICSVGRADEVTGVVARMARIGSSYSPSFSPDGSRLAFVSDLNGIPQVWTVASDGGWPTLVTGLDDPVSRVAWSPDGEWLAFSLAPGGGMNGQVYLVRPDGTDLRRVTDGGRDNNWLGRWITPNLLTLGSNRGDPGSVHSYFFEVDQNAMRRVVKNEGFGFLTDVNDAMSQVVVWRMQSRGDDNLFLVDLTTNEETLLTEHEGPGSFGVGKFSSDARTVYLSSNKDRDLSAFGRIRLDEEGNPGDIEILASRSDAELDTAVLTDDRSEALLIWNVAGRSEMSFLDLQTLTRVDGPELPAEIANGFTFSRDGERVAFSVSGAASPRDIWVYQRKDERFTQVTHSPHPGVDLSTLVRPELVRFKSHDGLMLSGWLYRPSTEERLPPFVLSFHGGPEGQERPSFRSDYQALLNKGIGVFAPNVRGSSGFGKKFVNLDNGALRIDGVKDIAACLDFVVDSRIADPERIGIMGGSYGGYMTMAGLSEYPDRFAAGANLFGVVNFETFFENTEPWMAAISTVEYGDPKTERELLRRLSPIHKVDRVRAPTIVLHGKNDTNVPVIEAEQVVESLTERGVPVEYVLFPDEGHGFRKQANRIRSTDEIVRWFDRYLNRRAGP